LLEAGGGILINDKRNFYKTLRKLFSDETLMEVVGKKSFEFVNKNVGTTDRIIKEIIRP